MPGDTSLEPRLSNSCRRAHLSYLDLVLRPMVGDLLAQRLPVAQGGAGGAARLTIDRGHGVGLVDGCAGASDYTSSCIGRSSRVRAGSPSMRWFHTSSGRARIGVQSGQGDRRPASRLVRALITSAAFARAEGQPLAQAFEPGGQHRQKVGHLIDGPLQPRLDSP